MNKFGKLARGNEEILQAAIDKQLEQEKSQEKAQANNVWRARLAARLNKVSMVSEIHFYPNGGMIAKAGGLEL